MSRLTKSWLACLFVLSLSPVQAEEMSLDQLIEKNIEARGGRAAWKAAKSARMEGSFMVAPGIEAPFTIYFKQPNKMRMEFELQGMKAVQAFDGESGWSVMPFMGNPDPQKMSDDELKNARRMADFEGPLVDWKAKGHQVELMGREDVEGTPAYKLKIVEDGETSFLYIDAEQFLEFHQDSTTTTQQGAEVKITTISSDYKKAGDLVLPHSIEMRQEGAPQGQVVTIKKIELNVDAVSDDLFAMPAPVAKPAPAGN